MFESRTLVAAWNNEVAGDIVAMWPHIVVAAGIDELQDVVVAVCSLHVATVVVVTCPATVDVVDEHGLFSLCPHASCHAERRLQQHIYSISL